MQNRSEMLHLLKTTTGIALLGICAFSFRSLRQSQVLHEKNGRKINQESAKKIYYSAIGSGIAGMYFSGIAKQLVGPAVYRGVNNLISMSSVDPRTNPNAGNGKNILGTVKDSTKNVWDPLRALLPRF